MKKWEIVEVGLKSLGYKPLCGKGYWETIVKMPNRELFDYKSGCCGAEVHIEKNRRKYGQNDISFACKECGWGLKASGVFAKRI